MTEPFIVSFLEREKKFIIYRKSFFREQFWVYIKDEYKQYPSGNYHNRNYDSKKVVWSNPIELLQDYLSKDKLIFSATEISGIKLEPSNYYWMNVKWFPAIFGSYLTHYKNYEMKTYTFQGLKEENAEYFFINN